MTLHLDPSSARRDIISDPSTPALQHDVSPPPITNTSTAANGTPESDPDPAPNQPPPFTAQDSDSSSPEAETDGPADNGEQAAKSPPADAAGGPGEAVDDGPGPEEDEDVSADEDDHAKEGAASTLTPLTDVTDEEPGTRHGSQEARPGDEQPDDEGYQTGGEGPSQRLEGHRKSSSDAGQPSKGSADDTHSEHNTEDPPYSDPGKSEGEQKPSRESKVSEHSPKPKSPSAAIKNSEDVSASSSPSLSPAVNGNSKATTKSPSPSKVVISAQDSKVGLILEINADLLRYGDCKN